MEQSPSRARLHKALQRLQRLIHSPTFQAIALAIVYILIASSISLSKYYAYHYSAAFDLGIYAQSLQSTLHGDILYASPEGMNHLGYHFSPILFLLVPIFWLAPYVETLLIVQSIALGASGYLVYKLARIQKLSHRTALFVEVLFLISPLLWGVNFYDFHPVALAVPTLLIMLIGLIQKRWKLFAIGLVLSLMIKEDVLMVLAVFGLVMMIACYVRDRKVDKVYLIVFLSAVATYGIAVVVARAVSGMDVPPMLMYASTRYTYINEPIGQAIVGAFGAFFSLPSLFLFIAYFLPLAFLPLLSPLWAAPALFLLAISMFSTRLGQHCLVQYPAAAIPFLFAAAISTLVQMKDKGNVQRFFVGNLQKVSLITIIILIAIAIIDFCPYGTFGYRGIPRLPRPHVAAINKVISLIPDGATVTAPNHIFPHLCTRTTVYMPQGGLEPNWSTGVFGLLDVDTKYVVVDYQQPWDYKAVQREKGFDWEGYLTDKYQLIAEIDDVCLYKLGYDGPPIIPP